MLMEAHSCAEMHTFMFLQPHQVLQLSSILPNVNDFRTTSNTKNPKNVPTQAPVPHRTYRDAHTETRNVLKCWMRNTGSCLTHQAASADRWQRNIFSWVCITRKCM
ncbi:hypothetical protein BaRGS_00000984 [Batillaria attramentaria]|uniref:Uncharacterized protein n=1 Tax=Batillaria attramentaria TaxID=370345 RepID=A0ABD0M852_9CAEN